jgi:hypothetical protein
MFDNNNIYKLIKRAKDKNCNSTDPMKRIIPNPIKFVYSFTLNAGNEPYIDDIINNKEKEEDKNNKEILKNKKNYHNAKKEENKDNKKLRKEEEKKYEKNDNINIIKEKTSINCEKKLNHFSGKSNEQNNKNNEISNNKNFNQLNKDEFDKKNNIKNIETNKEKEKNFLNKKRGNENIKEKTKEKKNNKYSNMVKNSMIHQIYNSKKINLWENDDSDTVDDCNNNDNDYKKKEMKNENILPLHKQLEFIHKCQNVFKKHDVAVKSDYDKDLDKGRVKKIHKNKIGFKKHKNYFQKISNKNINKLNRINK